MILLEQQKRIEAKKIITLLCGLSGGQTSG